jgi:hypothetical protein
MESVSVNDNITVTGFILRGKVWNPLTNDADAFRLMVDLDLWPCYENAGIKIKTKNGHTWCAVSDGDPHAATRRAIVLAAAAMVDTGVGEDV